MRVSETVGSRKEGRKKVLRQGEGECFYPHVHSKGSVSAIVFSLPVKTSVAITMPIHTHHMHTNAYKVQMHKTTPESFFHPRQYSAAA